ncbi:EAL domain-containing protein [Shewanella eurypsychrophilus]|uniref:EAL domain-containing protein n=1 Tax=Shewanella eurypsychrophilus TaxID=2593656 RepID=A0ABX6V0S4_9GAMM|nr:MULTISPECIES: EAL domain-containing protein [Shewanella]QFU20655.1 EAL domain-containing protein [Shewanella sp. YLB-09]QFU20935.1 EAL domain-containing protein [Shewanella sp. YLB-09]QPG56223.1 EAL domain-containing protein [Shewanella eurypsychrophilus]
MKFKSLSSFGLYSTFMIIILAVISYLYAFWKVFSEVESDSKQLLNYVEHKLWVAGNSLEKLNQIYFSSCDYLGQETLEEFLFDHLGAGLFLIRHKSSSPWTYCSVVGNIKVSQRDRNFKNLMYLDEGKRRAISVMGYDWQGIEKRDLFLSLESTDRINAVRIALEDSYSFFEDQCTDCRHVEVRLANDDLIFELGGIKSGVLTGIRAISTKFPLYIDAVVGINRVREVMLSSLIFTAPISVVFSLLCLYIVNLLKVLHNSLSYRLKVAIKKGELVAYYQPIIDAQTGYIVGAEALVRWFKPDGTIEPPGRFIQILEESELINELTLQLLRNIPVDLVDVLKESPNFRCSINLVPQHLESADFSDQLILLAEQGFPCHQLAIEITERYPLKNLRQARINVDKMKALGVCIELDDAGTGYGGASYLQELNIDVMKIDKLFVDTLIISPDRTQVLDANIQMALTLGMQIIAEGVEASSQSKTLLDKGVRFQQGFLFAKPLSAVEFVAFWHESYQAHDKSDSTDIPSLCAIKEE